ncbi:Trehalose utilization [Roseimaritima multifibrata]|uniref:Trehalose utilization n=1 Tax=Roseimaritima multifibrata TaxID=1930274 RepID=A0A517MBL0_9BACT|nr:ThuA domain-containing protein [Roseimaritima multifibrata]QDS92270.1 Trehalose utilization [Roseimaritima multifibrata]
MVHRRIPSLRTLLFAAGVVTFAFSMPSFAQSTDPKSPVAEETEQQAKPTRILLVTGGCCHDYKEQIKLIKKGLDKELGEIEWTVKEHGSERTIMPPIYNQGNWAAPYDLVIHNECFGGVEDGAFVERIVSGHVSAGVPAVVIHCSMHSYRAAATAETWRAFLGVTSRRHEKAKRALDVIPVAAEHPIMKGFPNKWQTPNGELYVIEKVWPTATVLAQAYSEEEKAEQPVVWINEYQGARVFGTTLGHHNETIADEHWMQMTANGIRWALDKKE